MKIYTCRIWVKCKETNMDCASRGVSCHAINPQVGFAIMEAYMKSIMAENQFSEKGHRLNYYIKEFVEYVKLN